MSNTINVLQLGNKDYSKEYKIHDSVKWYYEPDFKEIELYTFEVVILDRNITCEEKKLLFNYTKAWCLFILNTVDMNKETKWIFDSKKGKYVNHEWLKEFLLEAVTDYYAKPYGEKYYPEFMSIGEDIPKNNVKWEGKTIVTVEHDFGNEFSQAFFWRNTIPVEKDQSIDFWLEYEKEGNIEIKLRIIQFVSGTVASVQQVFEFNEEQLQDIVSITNKLDSGPIFTSILAKGKGKLKLIALHDRFSRRGKGQFLPGGDRRVSSKKEEVFFYFDPGDLKPPLNIYFSGYKTMEGFEGYNMLRRMGAPFLLVAEPRLEGGSFYIGSKEYEEMIKIGIQSYIDQLGFTNDQVIMSGLSMGTFGALYYGIDIKPFAIIVGKPLVSLGDVATNERINRPGAFPTSLDLIYKLYGELSNENVDKLNKKFWDKFDNTEWTYTKFVITYMYEDDYDSTAYPKLLTHINDENIEIYGKGFHGRHNDNTNGIVGWFIGRYYDILDTYFEREFEEE